MSEVNKANTQSLLNGEWVTNDTKTEENLPNRDNPNYQWSPRDEVVIFKPGRHVYQVKIVDETIAEVSTIFMTRDDALDYVLSKHRPVIQNMLTKCKVIESICVPIRNVPLGELNQNRKYETHQYGMRSPATLMYPSDIMKSSIFLEHITIEIQEFDTLSLCCPDPDTSCWVRFYNGAILELDLKSLHVVRAACLKSTNQLTLNDVKAFTSYSPPFYSIAQHTLY